MTVKSREGVRGWAVVADAFIRYSLRIRGVVVSWWMPWSSKPVAGCAEQAAVGSTPIHSRLLLTIADSSSMCIALSQNGTRDVARRCWIKKRGLKIEGSILNPLSPAYGRKKYVTIHVSERLDQFCRHQ